MVDDPADDRGGHVVVAEDGAPAGELEIRGDDQAALLVGVGDDLEQESGAFGVDGEVAEFVDGTAAETAGNSCSTGLQTVDHTQAEMYENSRNGFTPKTVASEIGDIQLDVPRDRGGSFTPRLVPKGARRLGGLDDMIISLYAGGMTIRGIQHHLAATIGTELSHETISKITDAVLEEVLAWQSRPTST